MVAGTRAHAILIQSAPYLIRGYLHLLPTADPIASFRHRKPMVPLTDAWIEYLAAGKPVHRSLGTIVVNRELADWFELAVEEEIEPPALPAGETGPMTRTSPTRSSGPPKTSVPSPSPSPLDAKPPPTLLRTLR